MSYLEVSNFKAGLDVRKSEMTTAPGALVVARDAFINEGGEFEKRRAFVKYALPASTFGLATTSTGFMTFGSVATPGAFPVTLWVGGPVVNYQRLQHPDGATAMTGIRSATPFGGNLVVVAEFGSDVYAFYNGTLIPDFIAGLVLSSYISGGGSSSTTRSNIAAALAGTITSPYSGVHSGSNTYFDFFGNGANDYSLSISVDAASTATITPTAQADAVAGSAATSAVGQFTITMGNSGGQITSVKVNTDECLSATVNWNTNAIQTAADVAANINANGSSLYDAAVSGSTVVLTKTATGATVNGYDVKVTVSGAVCIGNCSMSIVGPSFTLDSVTANGVELLTSPPIAYPGAFTGLDDFLSHAATGIVANINGGTSAGLSHGYVASSVSNYLFISKALTSSADAPITVRAVISPTTAGNGSGVGGGIETPLAANASPLAVAIDTPAFDGTNDYTKLVTCSPTGGLAPYRFAWRRISWVRYDGPTPGTPPTPTAPTAAATKFTHPYKLWGNSYTYNVQAIYVCDVTDSAGNLVTSPQVTITMTHVSWG